MGSLCVEVVTGEGVVVVEVVLGWKSSLMRAWQYGQSGMLLLLLTLMLM